MPPRRCLAPSTTISATPVRHQPALRVHPPDLDRGASERLDPLAERAQDRPNDRGLAGGPAARGNASTGTHIIYAVHTMVAGAWIEQLRARHGLTQSQLAYRAGTSQQAISRIERGVVSPSIAFLERLAATCGEELVLDARARQVPFEEAQLAEQAAMPIAARLALASSWNRLAGEMTGVAARTLRDG